MAGARRVLCAGCISVLVATACANWLAPLETGPVPHTEPDPRYEQLFPHYVELCAVSQYRSLRTGEGGIPGHAVMYLKGACKDESAAYPQLRPCERAATRTDDLEHGVGVSVNRHLANANWLATPGRDLFFDGNLAPGDRLTEAVFAQTLRAALDAGVFDGVVLRPDTPSPSGAAGLEEFVATQSLATDFALRFSRSVFCSRLPVRAEMMSDIIDYLNAVNRDYAEGVAEYEWSGYADNCVHLLRNSLAAASIWEPISVRTTKLRQFFNLAVPANEFVNLAKRGAYGPLVDGREIYRDDEARDALLDFDWLPRRHGALLVVLPVHANNDLYDARFRLLVAENPITRGVTRDAETLLGDARFTRLEPNLRYLRDVYRDILANRDERIAGGFLPFRSERYLRPAKRWYEYVEAQLTEVEAMLRSLGVPDRAAAAPSGIALGKAQ
jgi:hypothetical protein